MQLSILLLLFVTLIGGLSLILFRLYSLSSLRDELDSLSQKQAAGLTREEVDKLLRINREETITQILQAHTQLQNSQKHQWDVFYTQLVTLTQTLDQRLETVRQTVENRLGLLQTENAKKLEEMRQTVDEKLHASLEKRLGESFKLVSDRLEMVHKGLGEMQQLASGVGDLKKVLSNVKTRGIWGEIQLGSILEQLFFPDQYATNVKVKPNSSEVVEFALKLPGRNVNETVFLPIDSKFPQEFYEAVMAAQDSGDPVRVEEACKALETRVKQEAKSIKEKYIDPPHTTDFGILFLPTEGLYAEVLRRQGLFEVLQREYRVTVAGPTTLAAFLNSLQMGFRTLQIEKRSGEVWQILGSVKTEFGKFGDLLDKTHKKILEASHTLDDVARKSRTLERRLRDVQVGEAEPPVLQDTPLFFVSEGKEQ